MQRAAVDARRRGADDRPLPAGHRPRAGAHLRTRRSGSSSAARASIPTPRRPHGDRARDAVPRERWRSRVLRAIRVGSLTIVEGEARRTFGSGPPTATIHVHDPAVLAECSCVAAAGWPSPTPRACGTRPDLVAVIRLAARNAVLIDRVRAVTAPLWKPRQRVREALKRRTRQRSRRDIAAHYDLGNELFARMLDPTMMYSCALFERPGMTLEEASVAKLERVCERLDLGPEDRVLEIGTGWGGFAVHAAATRGCRVVTTTISRGAARLRGGAGPARPGSQDRVTVLMRDYRDLRGSFDKLVSIEMIEAVGWQQIGRFFARCSDLLTPHGAMLLQAITIDDRAYEVEKASQVLHPRVHLPRGLPALDGGDHAQRGAPHRSAGGRAWRTSPPATSRRCAAGATTSPPTATSWPRSATTSASSGSGRCTSPIARVDSPSGGSATCSCCWPSRGGRSRPGPRCGAPRSQQRANPCVSASRPQTLRRTSVI